MKIYTRTGDSGTTALVGGARTAKDDPRVEAYGTLDELMAHLGFLYDMMSEASGGGAFSDMQKQIATILERLMVCSAVLASDPDSAKRVPQIVAEDIKWLEDRTDDLLNGVAEIRYFTLPCGSKFLSYSHICRTVCRRAERRAITAARDYAISPETTAYINRLSDYLYALGRRIVHEVGVDEICWVP